ncbi:hypothetical protein RIF29_16929 [Crotalaria pallida]|uniref:Exocyst subunit Exo70 family protein n=1 Tax=Crotalaria pallida TaxID=3830 RepID=A0AAN9FM01_CROPI
MDWEVVELKIKTWLSAVKVAVSTLFHGERILYDHVFASAAEKRVPESCFAEITREGAGFLFGFPEMVAKCKKTPEKMFRTLDLYEAISNNWHQIQSIFSFESTSSVRSMAVTSMLKLDDAVRGMLSEFESAIQKESSKVPVPAGGVHPLTRYVMNYIKFLSDYSGVLGDIIVDYPQSPLPESYYRSPMRDENQWISNMHIRTNCVANSRGALQTRCESEILVVLCKSSGAERITGGPKLTLTCIRKKSQRPSEVAMKVYGSVWWFLASKVWKQKYRDQVMSRNRKDIDFRIHNYAGVEARVPWCSALDILICAKLL